MRVAGINPCSLVNGDGIRFVIFCQGCLRHCKGCQNPDTWDVHGGNEIPVEQIVNDILKRSAFIDGITLSGGEPFLQQEECIKLLKLLPNTLNIWIYTGFKYEEIWNTELANLADFLVDGAFEQENRVLGKPYGSSNQRIILAKKKVFVT